MLKNFRKVSANLYRSSAPAPNDLKWLKDNFNISRIISLDEETGNKLALACKLLRMEQVKLPIEGWKKSSLINFVSKIGAALDSDKKTLIHCLHGKDRTGMAVAIYRCKEEGWSVDKAIKEADSFGFGKGLDPKVVETFTSIIHDFANHEDVNEVSDIVDQSRESYDKYVDSPSSNLSWSPYGDRNVREAPFTPMTLNEGEGNPLGGFGPSIVGNGTVI